MDDERLIWTEDLSVNSLVIDVQHRHLFDLTNELACEKAAVEPEECARLLSGLTEYFRTHFSEEEAYMEQYGYPDLKQHKAEHAQFIKRISMFNVEYISSVPTKSEIIHLFTRFWLFHHVMKLDMQYRDFIAKKQDN